MSIYALQSGHNDHHKTLFARGFFHRVIEEGDFIFHVNFDYKGPVYGWSTMPDQYVLDFIFDREIKTQKTPLFIEFILTSSHAPFRRQPPYEEDWSKIDDGKIYHDLEAITFPIIWPDLSNAKEGYVASIDYELRVIVEFINKFLDDNTLILILGDHQPNVQITGLK